MWEQDKEMWLYSKRGKTFKGICGMMGYPDHITEGLSQDTPIFHV